MLTAEGNAIIDEHGEDPEDNTVHDRHYQIGESLDELSEGETILSDDIKANAGVNDRHRSQRRA
jgi:hypothetical protein